MSEQPDCGAAPAERHPGTTGRILYNLFEPRYITDVGRMMLNGVARVLMMYMMVRVMMPMLRLNRRRKDKQRQGEK